MRMFPELKLANAEAEVDRARLDEKLANLDEMKTAQNQSKKNQMNEIDLLTAEVVNIREIAESLPNNCFKQPRLEP